ncbi:alpha/beta hydrolase family protein [Nocardia sp. X0981]
MLHRFLVLVSLVVAGIAITSAPAHAEDAVLPAPTGPYSAGRTDTVVSVPDRDVPVSVWYPAAESGPAAPYIPARRPENAAEIAAHTAYRLYTPLAAGPMLAATVPATLDARPADLPALPVVVWSPGLGTPRWLASGLASDLASRGYVVVAVDHPGETPAVEVGDRVVVGAAAPTQEPEYMRAVLTRRVSDIGLVLDRLTELPLVGDRIDTERIAVAGHSYGGQTAVSVAAGDARIRTALVLDGSAGWDEVAEVPDLDRPVLLLAAGDMVHASWTSTAAVIGTMAEAGHYTGTDLPMLGGGAQLCGTIGAERGARITASVLAAWLDRHLRGRDTALPEGDPALRWRTR